MADHETKDSSEVDVNEKLRKTAEIEVEKAMENAMASLPVKGAGESEVAEQSSFQKQHLSEEKEVVEYVEPMQDPYGKAIKYLEKHNVMQLFQVFYITSQMYIFSFFLP